MQLPTRVPFLLSGPLFVCLQPLNQPLHLLLKKYIYSDLKQQLLSTTGRDDTQRALDEISSTMRRLDESLRPLQELLAHIHEISSRSTSLPRPEVSPSELVAADLNDIFDGSH